MLGSTEATGDETPSHRQERLAACTLDVLTTRKKWSLCDVTEVSAHTRGCHCTIIQVPHQRAVHLKFTQRYKQPHLHKLGRWRKSHTVKSTDTEYRRPKGVHAASLVNWSEARRTVCPTQTAREPPACTSVHGCLLAHMSQKRIEGGWMAAVRQN